MFHDYFVIAVLWVQLIFGLPLNFYAFYRLFIKRAPIANSSISAQFKLLQQHLNVADLLVLLFYVPHEIALHYTKNFWFACSTFCRLSKFWNNFAFHLSSNIIVSVAVERLISVTNMESLGHTRRRLKPMRWTLGIAWALAFACAAPQFFVFSIVKRENFPLT